MSTPDSNPNPTADWRKYPKSPNFFGIVIGSSIFLLVLLVAAWFLIHSDGTKMIPHGPNPTPNSMMRQPLLPGVTTVRSA